MLSRKWCELGLLIASSILTTVLFWDGHLDIEIAGLFFNWDGVGNPWPLQDYWLWRGLYDFGLPSVVVAGVIALFVALRNQFIHSHVGLRNPALYFLAVILLGPLLMVNLVLKDHWGRPRPREVVEFNGHYDYQPPVVVGDSGRKSFVCGHCSSGYMLFAFYFMLDKGKNLALLCTLLYSFLIGFARMTAGGHFVSDILWSGYVVFGVCWFLYYIVFREFVYEEHLQHAMPYEDRDKEPEWMKS